MDIINYVCQSNNKKNSIYQYSPILNLSNNKIIGFHDKYNKNDNNNVGILFKLYINEFKRENIIYKNKEKFNNKGVFKRIFRELDICHKNKNYTIIPREDFQFGMRLL